MNLIAPHACAALLSAWLVPDVQLTYAIEEGTQIAKNVSHEVEMKLVSGEAWMGDEELPMPEDFSMEIQHVHHLSMTDRYGPLVDGAPEFIVRTLSEYEDVLDAEVVDGRGEPEVVAMELESPLIGEAVRWTSDDATFTPTFENESSDVDTDLLDDLRFDLDGLGLLPPGDAVPSEGWEVPAAALGELLSLGGSFAGVPEAPPDDEGHCLLWAIALLPQLGELEGKVDLKLASFDEDEGIASLRLEAEVSSEQDSVASAKALGEGLDSDELDALKSLVVTTEMAIMGTVAWNVKLGRLDRFELTGDLSRKATIVGGAPAVDQDVEMRMELEFEGEASWALEFEEL